MSAQAVTFKIANERKKLSPRLQPAFPAAVELLVNLPQKEYNKDTTLRLAFTNVATENMAFTNYEAHNEPECS
jgi:hypothetical protein